MIERKIGKFKAKTDSGEIVTVEIYTKEYENRTRAGVQRGISSAKLYCPERDAMVNMDPDDETHTHFTIVGVFGPEHIEMIDETP